MNNLDTDERPGQPDAPKEKPHPLDYAPRAPRAAPKPERPGFFRGARVNPKRPSTL